MTLYVFCVKYFMSLKSCSNLIFYPLLSSVTLGIHEISISKVMQINLNILISYEA